MVKLDKFLDQLFKNLSIASQEKEKTINIYGNDYNTFDGTCIRDYIHVSDIAKIHILVLKKHLNRKKNRYFKLWLWKGYSVKEA